MNEQKIKYGYGIEYQCNGEKPDLPDDVLVDIKDKGWTDFGGFPRPAKVWDWSDVNKFRIVDGRYKPVNIDLIGDPPTPYIRADSDDWLVVPRVGDKIIANFPTKKDGKNVYEPRLCEVLRLGVDVDAAGEFVVMCIERDSREYTAVTWIDQWRPTKGESNQ
jgi:hypothetical protein